MQLKRVMQQMKAVYDKEQIKNHVLLEENSQLIRNSTMTSPILSPKRSVSPQRAMQTVLSIPRQQQRRIE